MADTKHPLCFPDDTATFLFRVDPNPQLAIVLSSTRLPQFGKRYLSPLVPKDSLLSFKAALKTHLCASARDHTVFEYLEQCYYNYVILKCDIIIIIYIFNVIYLLSDM